MKVTPKNSRSGVDFMTMTRSARKKQQEQIERESWVPVTTDANQQAPISDDTKSSAHASVTGVPVTHSSAPISVDTEDKTSRAPVTCSSATLKRDDGRVTRAMKKKMEEESEKKKTKDKRRRRRR